MLGPMPDHIGLPVLVTMFVLALILFGPGHQGRGRR